MRTAARVLGAVAALLILFLLVGLLLPGSWSAEETIVIDAPPESIFPRINSVSRWESWTEPWPEGGAEGPDAGVGAIRTWNDPVLGAGSFTIVGSDPPRRVSYEVLVEGSMRWDGQLSLAPIRDRGPQSRTLVTWSESGDFGWNPLMGYMARMMRSSQGDELARGLTRLREIVEGEEAGPS